MPTLPFRTVHARSDRASHLVVVSPALYGCTPADLPSATLCGQPVSGLCADGIGDVECLRCLMVTPRFMSLPAFGHLGRA